MSQIVERQDYEESLKNFRDWYSVIKTAENKGLEKGRKEGREEGHEEERIQNIRRMRSKGLDDKTIADLLGLDIDFVNENRINSNY